MKIEPYHTTDELKRLFRKEKDSRISTRIRAVYLALMGKTSPQIAKLLGYSRRRIQDWIYAYNQKGLEGLQDSHGRGTGCKLNTDQLQWLRQRIEEGPRPEDGVCVKNFKASSPNNLGFITASAVFINYCIGWVTAMSHQGLIIPKATRKRVSPLKKSR